MKADRKIRKKELFEKMMNTLRSYNDFLVVEMNNITSKQLQECKRCWRGKAEFLMLKNTSMRKALNDLIKEDKRHEKMLDSINGNVAFIMLKGEKIPEIKKIIGENERRDYARIGAVAQEDLWIEPHLTAMGTDKVPILTSLGITDYKITKSKVELTSKLRVLEKGVRIKPAQAELLGIMEIKPLVYMMKIQNIFEGGEFYEPWILDITPEDIENSYKQVLSEVAAISLATNILTQASVPYNLKNCFTDAIALSVAAEFQTIQSAAFMQ